MAFVSDYPAAVPKNVRFTVLWRPTRERPATADSSKMLGTYNPLLPQDHEQRLVINEERVKYWLGVGAQPTERLEKLFSNLGLVKAPALREQPKKSAPKAKAQERMKEKEAAAAANAEALLLPNKLFSTVF